MVVSGLPTPIEADVLLFLGLLLAAAATAILSAEFGWRRLFYAAKPLTTLIILVEAGLVTPAATGARIPLLIALGLALAGDIVLMLPRDSFRAGMAAFLLAQLAFIWAFATRLSGAPPIGGLLFLLGIALLAVLALRKDLGALAAPVAVYAVVLMLMVWTAWGAMVLVPSGLTRAGFSGAVLFLMSDVVLAVRRFRASFPGGQALTLGTYFAALFLITLSFSAS